MVTSLWNLMAGAYDIHIQSVVTRYRKSRGRSTEGEAGKFLIPFLCVEMESCKRRDTLLFSHLEFTNVTNSDNPRNPEGFFPCFIDLVLNPASL